MQIHSARHSENSQVHAVGTRDLLTIRRHPGRRRTWVSRRSPTRINLVRLRPRSREASLRLPTTRRLCTTSWALWKVATWILLVRS